jgi:uncharacterized protein (TIGR03067 family)
MAKQLLSVHLVLCLIPGPVLSEENKNDEESKRLQGTWQAICWEEDGDKDEPKVRAEILRYVRWIFEDDKVTMTRAFTVTRFGINDPIGKTEVKGPGGKSILTYKIDASKNPKTLIATSMNPDDGTVVRAIYKLQDDVLTVCMRKKDQTPKEFSAKKGSDCILITLKKDKGK